METVPAPGKQRDSQLNNERYPENPVKVDLRVPERDNQNTSNIDCILPNRSPNFYERVGKYRKSSKVYENMRM